MEFGIALYDALVSANVDAPKAKAVVTTLEKELMDKLATKQDLEVFKLATKQDFESLKVTFEGFKVSTKKDLEALELRMTIKLGAIVLTGMAFFAAIQKYLN